MKSAILAMVWWMSLTALVFAEEVHEFIPVLKVGSEVYSNVTVTTVTKSDIYFIFGQGVGSAKLKNLDPDLQKHFHYDAVAIAATEKKQKADQRLYALPADEVAKLINKTNAQEIMDGAILRVKAIINQPVKQYGETPGMNGVAIYKPGWFHPGALRPDFNHADVRTTQDVEYGQNAYCSSDLNPGIVFRGADIEFNSATKYFYTDRSLPKKRLTNEEMLEVNRYYRIIGRCEHELRQ